MVSVCPFRMRFSPLFGNGRSETKTKILLPRRALWQISSVCRRARERESRVRTQVFFCASLLSPSRRRFFFFDAFFLSFFPRTKKKKKKKKPMMCHRRRRRRRRRRGGGGRRHTHTHTHKKRYRKPAHSSTLPHGLLILYVVLF